MGCDDIRCNKYLCGAGCSTIPAREKENVYVKPLSKAKYVGALQGITEEEQGPLVRQPAQSARLARTLHNAAQELWDACTHTDPTKDVGRGPRHRPRILAAAPAE
jgi:hypothetical protein